MSNQGCNEGGKRRTIPRAPDDWVAPKGPNNVASFSSIQLHLRKGLRFEHEAPNFFLALGAISPRYARVVPWYNGKGLGVRLNSAAFSYIRSSYVSSIIDIARTVFTKAKFA